MKRTEATALQRVSVRPGAQRFAARSGHDPAMGRTAQIVQEEFVSHGHQLLLELLLELLIAAASHSALQVKAPRSSPPRTSSRGRS